MTSFGSCATFVAAAAAYLFRMCFLLRTYRSTLPWQLSHVHVSVKYLFIYLFNSEIFILENEIFLKIQHFLSLKKNYGFFFWG
jgi:hypothetical protein